MYAVFKRELFSLLNSLMAYITIGIFLLATGLLLWFFPDTSILDYGYAELGSFFGLVPFLFMFLIPGITMRAIAEERREGTFVILTTKPIGDWQILMGKYLACLVLVVLALLPSLIYLYTIYALSLPPGNVDSGAVAGSYVGLILLGATFVAMGIFASSFTRNQVIAFAIAVFLSFIFYSGLDAMSKVFILRDLENILLEISISQHYQSLSRGVIDTRDLIYFISMIFLFLGLTHLVLGGRKW